MSSVSPEFFGPPSSYDVTPDQPESRADARAQRCVAVRATAGFLAVAVGLFGVHEGRAYLQHKLDHGNSAEAGQEPR